jgi:hypothetical protein
MEKIAQENHAQLAAMMKATEGARVVSEAHKNIKRGGEISTMSQLIVPQVALIITTTSVTSNIASDGLVVAADRIASLGYTICRPWSN